VIAPRPARFLDRLGRYPTRLDLLASTRPRTARDVGDRLPVTIAPAVRLAVGSYYPRAALGRRR
jgi:hypothetical protein